MPVKIHNADVHLINLRTRMPFKYGIATMTRMPMAFVRVNALIDGAAVSGVSSDLLPPKWFTKDPQKPVLEEIQDMLGVIQSACGLVSGMEDGSAFSLWRQLYEAQGRSTAGRQHPPLLAHFGTSLVERALIEACCRHAGKPFHEAVRSNALGVDLGSLHPELRGQQPGDLLPSKPLPRVMARHTVGLADPLADGDIPEGERLDDSLPQSLEACIRAYGLKHFKLKVGGQVDADVERLKRIAAIIEQYAPQDYAFTIDGNEQFKSLADFHQFWELLSHQDGLRSFLNRLLFIEQPLHRRHALDEGVRQDFDRWMDRPPVIIDESDGTVESARQAVELGYDGTSHKNCKGVFKGLANRCLFVARQRRNTGRRFLMSGEDLCNMGPVALLQDLAVCAALGIESVERNGHHYNAGLSQFPASVQRQTLDAHGDLYHAAPGGWPTLSIRQGLLALGSVNRAPFGVGVAFDPALFTPADRFVPEL